MNKVAIGIVAAVVIIGAGWYFFMGGSVPEGAVSGSMMAPQPLVGTPTNSQMTLKELLAGDASQQCTFIDNTNDTATQGMIYVSGGKVRGDFSTTQQGKTVSVHMVADGAAMHTWADGMKDGVTVSMMAAKPAGAPQQGYDPDKKIDYHCTPWTADTTKFDLPKDVNFRDVAGMMQGMPAAQ